MNFALKSKMNLVYVGLVVICLLYSVTSVNSRVRRETGCPPEEDVVPCTCYYGGNLACINVNSVESLRNVFLNSARYTYKQVNISFSYLSYLPHEMFDQTTIYELILYNVTLVQLFDVPPSGLGNIDKLHIENSVVNQRISWKLLENLTNLRVLDVYFNRIRTLDEAFGQHVTRNLQQISFYSTETKLIKPGVLTEFVNLNKVAMDACKLKTLTRDIFPRPFNVMFLHFNDNKITSIPEDLFVDMPRLQTMSMKKNLLTTVPEAAFDGRHTKITYVKFDDNPLKCDCLLVWIVRNKPEVLGGSCDLPRRLKGRRLQELSTSDFNC